MKQPLLRLTGLLVICSSTWGLSDEVQAPTAAETDPALFAVDMYHRLRTTEGNLFFSPLSISSAMAMAYEGADNNTATEIAKAMHFRADKREARTLHSGLIAALRRRGNDGDNKLAIANALFLMPGKPSPERRYLDLLENSYDAGIFRGDLDAINSWVQKNTEGKINEIFDQLDPGTVLAILNAVYFKGTWKNQFEKSATRDGDFHLGGGGTAKVPMMHQYDEVFAYGEDPGFLMLEMPYSSGLAMQVYLPREGAGLAEFENNLKGDNLVRWMGGDQMKRDHFTVSMPKFKFGTSYDLRTPMQELGVVEAFDGNKADFGGMGFAKGEVSITKIAHKAMIEVNEEGAEAAAVTGFAQGEESEPETLEFRVDRPFFFILCDKETKAILFMGRVVDPRG